MKEIATLLGFDLPINDIFSRNKVGTLVFTLERLIVLLEEYGKADECTLHALKLKLSAYQNLLFALKQYSCADSGDSRLVLCRVNFFQVGGEIFSILIRHVLESISDLKNNITLEFGLRKCNRNGVFQARQFVGLGAGNSDLIFLLELL